MAPTFPEADELFADRYRMDSIIAEGGFGRVYRATQIDLDRDVAIKILRPDPKGGDGATKKGAALEAVIKRFEREARLASRLRDTHTVTVHDFGSTDEGLLYMVMEFVDGRTVGQLVDDEGRIPPVRAVALVQQALSSLREAHELGVLHRDIKPHNIMLYDHLGREHVKVLDFGLVKSMGGGKEGSGSTSQVDLTSEGALLGTPRYMSPEQIRGDDMGPPSDIYSLGLVFYEMLSGTKAVDADSTMNIIARHLDPRPFKLPDDLQLPGRLLGVLSKMLEKDPAVRYQRVAEVADALQNWDNEGPVGATPDSTMDVVLEPVDEPSIELAGAVDGANRRTLIIVAGTIGALVLIIAAAAIVSLGSNRILIDPSVPYGSADQLPGASEQEAEVAEAREEATAVAHSDEEPAEPMVIEPAEVADAGARPAAVESGEEDVGLPAEEEPEDTPEPDDDADEPAEQEDPEPVKRPTRPRFKILE